MAITFFKGKLRLLSEFQLFEDIMIGTSNPRFLIQIDEIFEFSDFVPFFTI